MSDARKAAGILVSPPEHPEGCRCLQRRTEQSGEVDSHHTSRTQEIALPAARPFTGFLPRPGYVPPKIIVSDLLAGASQLGVMLIEPEGAAHLARMTREVAGTLDPRLPARKAPPPAYGPLNLRTAGSPPAAPGSYPPPTSFAHPPRPPVAPAAPRYPAPPPIPAAALRSSSPSPAAAAPKVVAGADLLTALEDFGFEP